MDVKQAICLSSTGERVEEDLPAVKLQILLVAFQSLTGGGPVIAAEIPDGTCEG